MMDRNWVESVEKWIAQRELSISHSQEMIRTNEVQIKMLHEQNHLAKEQIKLDALVIENQRKILREHLDKK